MYDIHIYDTSMSICMHFEMSHNFCFDIILCMNGLLMNSYIAVYFFTYPMLCCKQIKLMSIE